MEIIEIILYIFIIIITGIIVYDSYKWDKRQEEIYQAELEIRLREKGQLK